MMKKILSLPCYLWFLLGLSLSFCLSATPVFATNAPPKVAWMTGPQVIKMGDNLATLNLPKGYLFANAEDTAKLMEYIGNPLDKQEIGLVVADDKQKDWMLVFSYNPIGYVKDEESKSIDKNAILENIKKGTEEDNKERQKKGIPSLEVTGWAEEPFYDSKSHNLVWAIAATSNGKQILNYNTRKLGRNGFTSLNLIVKPEKLSQAKPELEKLIENYTYVEGKRYTDFISGQDKVAEVGLIALIGGGGVAAAKTGVFTKLLLFLAVAFKKIWFMVFIGGAAAIKSLFGGKKNKVDNVNTVATEGEQTPPEK